eukprot:scaffold16621_cov63-Phaeocystis_antarctica.AAC.1
MSKFAAFAALHCLWLSRPLFSETHGVLRPVARARGPLYILGFLLGEGPPERGGEGKSPGS